MSNIRIVRVAATAFLIVGPRSVADQIDAYPTVPWAQPFLIVGVLPPARWLIGDITDMSAIVIRVLPGEF